MLGQATLRAPDDGMGSVEVEVVLNDEPATHSPDQRAQAGQKTLHGQDRKAKRQKPCKLPACGNELSDELAADEESSEVFKYAKELIAAREDATITVRGWTLRYALRKDPEGKQGKPKLGDIYVTPPAPAWAGCDPTAEYKPGKIRSMVALHEILRIRHEARARGEPPWEPPRVGDVVEVEIEDEHTLTAGSGAVWRRAEVRKQQPCDGRFLVCVLAPSGAPDEAFLEWYARENEGIEWRRLDKQPGTRPTKTAKSKAPRPEVAAEPKPKKRRTKSEVAASNSAAAAQAAPAAEMGGGAGEGKVGRAALRGIAWTADEDAAVMRAWSTDLKCDGTMIEFYADHACEMTVSQGEPPGGCVSMRAELLS